MSSWSLDAWDQRARQLLDDGTRPHFAPDPSEVECHRRILGAFRRRAAPSTPPRLLVLGATPELADLGLELGFGVLRIDANPGMFEAAKLREQVRRRDAERGLVADWRDLAPVPARSVDAVVGDAALNNVADRDMGTVLDELRRVLVPGGIVCLKQIVFPVAAPEAFELGPMVRARRRGDLPWTAFRTLVRFWCFREAAYDSVTKILDARLVYDAVEREHAAGRWTAEEYAFLARSTSRLRHTIYVADEQEARLRDAFGPVRRHAASDALHHRYFFPLYEVRNA